MSDAARPVMKVRVGRSRQKIHTASVTKIDARLASKVEFATEVYWIDQCQKARSPAKAKPAARSGFQRRGVGARGAENQTSSHRTGAASATRQNALAVGPTSLTRTK